MISHKYVKKAFLIFWSLLFCNGCTVLFGAENTSSTINTLETVKSNIKFYAQFNTQFLNLNFAKKPCPDSSDIQDILNLFHQFSEQDELFPLSMCASEKCLLGAFSPNNYRRIFEDRIAKEVMRSKKEHIDYVSFGSGDLLQDCRIIDNLLKNTSKTFKLHFIDIDYVPIETLKKTAGVSHSVFFSQDSLNAELLVTFFKNLMPVINDTNAVKQLLIQAIVQWFTAHKLHLYLKKQHKNNVPEFVLYSNIEYFPIDTNVDIIHAVDIQQYEEKEESNASTHYIYFCYNLLTRNPDLKNIWLDYDDDKDKSKAFLKTIFLKNGKPYIKIEDL